MNRRASQRFWTIAGVALLWPAASGAEAESAAISALEWMAGSWSGTQEGVASEEHWTTAAGGALVGMHKDVRGDRMISFEFLHIVADETGRICYLASPGGAPPTAFCATQIGERRVVFENREHDFPQRLRYWLDDAGRLHARIEGPVDGRELSTEWIWSRASP